MLYKLQVLTAPLCDLSLVVLCILHSLINCDYCYVLFVSFIFVFSATETRIERIEAKLYFSPLQSQTTLLTAIHSSHDVAYGGYVESIFIGSCFFKPCHQKKKVSAKNSVKGRAGKILREDRRMRKGFWLKLLSRILLQAGPRD